MRDLFEELRVALSPHLDEDADRDDAVRSVLDVISGGVVDSEVAAVIAKHPEPARLSMEEFSEMVQQRAEQMHRMAERQ